MNIKKTLLAVAFAVSCMAMSAQTSDTQIVKYTFSPYWYGQAQIGVQETLGEGSFGKLLSPNANIAIGRQFNPLFGLRLGIGSWKSKGAIDVDVTNNNFAVTNINRDWKYTYLAPALDLTLNLTNALGGYNPERKIDVNIFAGIGVNIAWGNDQAAEVFSAIKAVNNDPAVTDLLSYQWDGTHARLLGRMGAAADYKINENWKVGLEFNANVLNDHYNSKKAGNADWYFNLLAGVKYTFGPQYWEKKVIDLERIVEVEKVVERIVEVPVSVDENITADIVMPDSIRRDVFFAINSSKITLFEQQKVRDIAEYMKANPDTKVNIAGYADSKTGTVAINVSLAARRANAVADMLKKQYNIAADRITVTSMSSKEYQPYPAPEPYQLNRVAICIVK